MHRAYRHNVEILPELERLFGKHLASDPSISMKQVLDDHLMEDCKGTTPSIVDWFIGIKPQAWMRKNADITTEDSAQLMANKFGGHASEYLAICQYMNEGQSHPLLSGWRYRAWRWHSFATFDVERKFGVSFVNTAGRNVIVRYVAERHITSSLGRMPSMQDWYSTIKIGRASCRERV